VEEVAIVVKTDLSLEVAANLYGRDARQNSLGLRSDQTTTVFRIRAHQVSFVSSVRVHWTIESRCPIEVCGVEMWVRDDDSFQAAV